MRDVILSWLVCLIPRFVCRWIWYNGCPTFIAPHILGRILGCDAKRVK